MAEDIVLGATVQGDDVQTVAAFDLAEGPIALVLIPRIALRGFYDLDPVRTGHLSGGPGALDQLHVVENFRGENSSHRAADAELACQGAGVDAFDADDVVLREIF